MRCLPCLFHKAKCAPCAKIWLIWPGVRSTPDSSQEHPLPSGSVNGVERWDLESRPPCRLKAAAPTASWTCPCYWSFYSTPCPFHLQGTSAASQESHQAALYLFFWLKVATWDQNKLNWFKIRMSFVEIQLQVDFPPGGMRSQKGFREDKVGGFPGRRSAVYKSGSLLHLLVVYWLCNKETTEQRKYLKVAGGPGASSWWWSLASRGWKSAIQGIYAITTRFNPCGLNPQSFLPWTSLCRPSTGSYQEPVLTGILVHALLHTSLVTRLSEPLDPPALPPSCPACCYFCPLSICSLKTSQHDL